MGDESRDLFLLRFVWHFIISFFHPLCPHYYCIFYLTPVCYPINVFQRTLVSHSCLLAHASYTRVSGCAQPDSWVRGVRICSTHCEDESVKFTFTKRSFRGRPELMVSGGDEGKQGAQQEVRERSRNSFASAAKVTFFVILMQIFIHKLL